MSRAHLIGSIYSRVEGLIRKNHLQEIDRPVWFDVYKQFPPAYEPSFKRLEPDINLRNIFYREDTLRAKIHRAFEDRLGVFNLMGNKQSFSDTLLKTGLEYISQGMSEDEAVRKLEDTFKTDLVKSEPESESLVESDKSVKEILKEIF